MGQREAYALPVVIDPSDTICFQIQVPNDRQHIAAFMGQIYKLSYWDAWKQDSAHTGKLAGAVWLKIFDQLIAGCPLPPSKALSGMEMEDFMPLRVDCDCNVFVTCCDGTEKRILTSDQVAKLIQGTPGNGSPQPPTGGGSQCYDLTLQANAETIIPFPVSTGDILTLQSALGAGGDGAGNWYCPDGSQFFGGACVGFGHLSGTDPVPTINHMRLLYHIGSNYYDAMAGPFTVPSGVSLVQPTLVLNDVTRSDNSGSYQITVCAQNNRTGVWCRYQDFTLSNGGWEHDTPCFSDEGSWSPGSGWVPGDAANHGSGYRRRICFMVNISPAIELTDIDILMDFTLGSADFPTDYRQTISLNGSLVLHHDHSDAITGTNVHLLWSGDTTGVTQISVQIDTSVETSAIYSGSATVKAVTINGKGAAPSIGVPC
jgi:hypothetical protein